MMNWIIVCSFCYSALMLSFFFGGGFVDNELVNERDDCSVMWGVME